jgi:hypothetical protein
VAVAFGSLGSGGIARDGRLAWAPYLSRISPWLQIAVLLVGITWAAAHVRRIADRLGGGGRLALPFLAFNLIPAVAMLWILTG